MTMGDITTVPGTPVNRKQRFLKLQSTGQQVFSPGHRISSSCTTASTTYPSFLADKPDLLTYKNLYIEQQRVLWHLID
ncbi:unnamed protein product [Caretta caretta]